MDNPQHYQPLSHALHPPSSALNRGQSNHYVDTTRHTYSESSRNQPAQPSAQHEEEEEEEEEEDDGDEGLVEEQLNQNDAEMHGSDHASPRPSSSTDIQTANQMPRQGEQDSPAPEQKRRPGRPRGSKNRRPRVGAAKHETQFYYQTHAPDAPNASTGATPQHANITSQNQQYYEFQWRVLNLCAEFYGAAEELVKGTSPLVIAQCYSMGPGVKIDPLVMIGEAKRVCDTLLANPSQLVTNPPPPIYPVLPGFYQPVPQPNNNYVATTSAVGTSPSASTSNGPSVITNPQTFVVPLGAQPPYPQYPMYGPPPGQYPTTPYYQYPPYGQPGVYYAQPPPPPPPQSMPHHPPGPTVPSTSATPVAAPQIPTATITTTPATGGTVIGNQGAWSDEETERLKKLTEDSRAKGSSGEIDWDWVIQEWGISRTRHQILIKATAMGLKESSTRPTKRRRDNEESASVTPAMGSLQPPSTSTPSVSSPPQSTSQAASTPTASPAMQSQQRPSSSKGPVPANPNPTVASKLPWPMPTVAVNTPSPVLSTSASVQDQRSSYYRPRPSQDPSTKQSTVPQSSIQQPHPFIYAPNGQISPNMRPKENGK